MFAGFFFVVGDCPMRVCADRRKAAEARSVGAMRLRDCNEEMRGKRIGDSVILARGFLQG
jgi:hypothetical protein